MRALTGRPSDHSYTLRVVGSGIKAQSSNPEVRVKVVDPVVNQIIDKLRHINQVSSHLRSSLSGDSIHLFSLLPAHVRPSGSFQPCLCLRMMRLALYRRFFTRNSCDGSLWAAARLLKSATLASPGGRRKARSHLLTPCWHPFPD